MKKYFKHACSAAAVLLFIACSAEPEDAEPVRVHPDFSLSAAELESILDTEDPPVRERILERPEYFLELMKKLLSDDPMLTVLVDKAHALPAEYAPEDLVALKTYPLDLSRPEHRLRSIVMPDLLAMVTAAGREELRLLISSCYRSYDYQKRLFDWHVKELGEEQAERESARPGTSQHQLGTTIDFGSITQDFAFTGAGMWIKEHAAEFGFSLSYPKGKEAQTGYMWEPWHYRYIGRHAAEMEQEFFSGFQQQFLECLHRLKTVFAERRIPDKL